MTLIEQTHREYVKNHPELAKHIPKKTYSNKVIIYPSDILTHHPLAAYGSNGKPTKIPAEIAAQRQQEYAGYQLIYPTNGNRTILHLKTELIEVLDAASQDRAINRKVLIEYILSDWLIIQPHTCPR